MTVFVYAGLKSVADAWVAGQRIDPAGCRTFGSYSAWAGQHYRPGDRVVIVGELTPQMRQVIGRLLDVCGEPKPVRELVAGPVWRPARYLS